MPGLVGILDDSAFNLAEQGLISISDLPFSGFFAVDPNIQIRVYDVATPTEVIAMQFFPPLVIEETVHGGGPRGLPTKVREAQRIRQLMRLRRMLDDEEVLLLME